MNSYGNKLGPHRFHLLQVSSASSEPSGHSGSPSHRQRPGTHWPFKQANSAGAHVFLAARKEKGNTHGGEEEEREDFEAE